jgi:putative ABC transport system permease protein
MNRFRPGLVGEVVRMALETLRANKLRSGLTVLGVVIGITAIVGMTALIRGFDQSLRDSIRAIGPNTIFIARFSGVSFAAGKELSELLKRPNLTPDDARAIDRQASTIQVVDLMLGDGGPPTQERIYYKNERTKLLNILGTTESFPEVVRITIDAGRFFSTAEVQHRRPVVVLGRTAFEVLFPNADPIGKLVRIGSEQYTVIGVFGKRPTAGGFNLGQDDFAVIPQTTYQKQFGIRAVRAFRGEHRSILIAAVPRDDVPREDALAEIEQIMRIRHGLRLEEANDFDLLTQDAVLKVWDQVSQATFLGLVVISSIALMVGGIGVMAIMTITVTERTREIGVRKALGARRREILWQFLVEAAFLTSTGGVLGILLGSAIGLAVHYFSGFPVSLPWWSFALGIGFSASVGIFFGLFPAIRASRLDPIEALRYE